MRCAASTQSPERFHFFLCCRRYRFFHPAFRGLLLCKIPNGTVQSCATLSTRGGFEAPLSARFDSAILHHTLCPATATA